MKKALALFTDNRPSTPDLEAQLVALGLRHTPTSVAELRERIHDVGADILLVDGALFSRLPAPEQEWLTSACCHTSLPVLLFDTDPPLTGLDRFGWTCGVIHDPHDRIELAEKISTYRQLGALEHEVNDLQNKIEARWREDEEDLRSAAQIQQSLLPKRLPALPHFNVACHFHPYEKIGGDLFNLRQVDEDNLMLFLLDVSGHGISSAMVSISVYQSLSLHTGQIVKRAIDTPPYYRLLPPIEVMNELASEYPFERFEMFFTIVYMLINIHTGVARYCSAGHPPPILQRRDGAIERLTVGGGLIGLTDTGPFEQGEVTLQTGDRLFLFSDGLLDHSNAFGEPFGDTRLIESLHRNGASLQQSCQAAIDAMHNFRGTMPAQDDVSLLGVEFTKSDQTSP